MELVQVLQFVAQVVFNVAMVNVLFVQMVTIWYLINVNNVDQVLTTMELAARLVLQDVLLIAIGVKLVLLVQLVSIMI